MALDLERGDEGRDVFGKLGSYRADGGPVIEEGGGDGLSGGIGGGDEVEEEGHAVGVLRVEGGRGGVVAEGAVRAVIAVGDYGVLEGGGTGHPERSIGCPVGRVEPAGELGPSC